MPERALVFEPKKNRNNKDRIELSHISVSRDLLYTLAIFINMLLLVRMRTRWSVQTTLILCCLLMGMLLRDMRSIVMFRNFVNDTDCSILIRMPFSLFLIGQHRVVLAYTKLVSPTSLLASRHFMRSQINRVINLSAEVESSPFCCISRIGRRPKVNGKAFNWKR